MRAFMKRPYMRRRAESGEVQDVFLKDLTEEETTVLLDYLVKQFGPDAAHVRTGQDPAVYQFSPVEMRHRGLGNVAFVDAHAEAMTLKQLGYELNDKGVPLPVLDPTGANVKATNRLWTGLGQDRFADERERSQSP